ncbi:MAG: high frequency lysogenization protein HflD [Gammaproteobacteria bacterium]|nr:high frequency lysogenization protein HflD [Gammaproteobacteria bacterium]NIR84427.1 high frequency lysogenization protein HflD [Gammaproteobacteria bacterium]NIR90908.1 high frequency lysogenization protein HflD [Gammaproteobacteria bacterium]NIU07094.1 high frequency lysogenization protein HflD [Gammaproteobacteria bacterium]NIV76223.1 high frequency lysogenization protein HflD [Gammaproteobacteria bacterium]
MSDHPEQNRVIALAGLFQAAALVQQIARDGSADAEAFQVSMESVLRLDAETPEAVYGGRRGLRLGLTELCKQLDKAREGRDADLVRYALSLMFLERKFMRRRDLLDAVRQGVETANAQAEHFSPTHSNVVAKLADLYLNTISTLTPRIIVTGDPNYLNNPENANKIRSALLAGVRATVLWRQLGGNRLRLLFTRRRVLTTAREMLEAIQQEPGAASGDHEDSTPG